MLVRKVGFEFEFPAVLKNGTGATRKKIKAMWRAFANANPSWHLNVEKIGKVVTGVKRTYGGYTEVINSDGGVCTVEFSLRPYPDVGQAIRHFAQMFRAVNAVAHPLGITFLAMGMQPITGYDPAYETEKDWYRLLVRKLPEHHYAVPFASHQTSVDISVKEWVPVVNMLSALSGPMIALVAGSPIANGKRSPFKESRLKVWKDWNAQVRPQYVPYFSNSLPEKPFQDLDDYIRFYWNTQLYFVTHGKSTGYDVLGNKRWIDFLRSKKPVAAWGTDGRTTTLLPADAMLNTIHQYGWLSAKVHYQFDDRVTIPAVLDAYDHHRIGSYFQRHVTRCYIENRPCGVSAKGEEAAMPALTLGLIENYTKALKLSRTLPWNEWKKIRNDAAKQGLDFQYTAKRSLAIVGDILQLGREGLTRRGHGEEAYLKPLERRFETHTTNADEIIATYNEGGIPFVVQRHGYRPGAPEIQKVS